MSDEMDKGIQSVVTQLVSPALHPSLPRLSPPNQALQSSPEVENG